MFWDNLCCVLKDIWQIPSYYENVFGFTGSSDETPFEKLSLTCAAGGKNLLYFGGESGRIYFLQDDFVLKSFNAFEGPIQHIVEIPVDPYDKEKVRDDSNVHVLVGGIFMVLGEILLIWEQIWWNFIEFPWFLANLGF